MPYYLCENHLTTANLSRSIDIRFMNDDSIPPNMLEGIRTEQQIQAVLQGKKYKGLTPFGTKLRQKVIDPIVLPKLRQPRKPILVIGITDGQPAGENNGSLEDTIRYAVNSTSNLGPGAIAFQFAQVGNDQKGKWMALVSSILLPGYKS